MNDVGNNSTLYLYADDTKIFRQIFTPEDCEVLQKDVYDMSLWSDKSLLKFHQQMVERLFLAVPWGCLRFVIVVFPDHTHYFDLTQLFQLREDVTTQRNSL